MPVLRARALAFLGSRKQPLRFLIAGGINTAFGLSLYPALLWASPWLRLHYLIALGIAQVISLTFAFTVYKSFVFRGKSNPLREVSAFISFYGVNYAVNWAALPFLVEVVHIPPVIAQIGFTIVLIVGSYFWHSKVTFRSLDQPRQKPNT